MNQDPTKNKTKEIFFENLDFDFSLFLTSLLKPLRFNGSIDFSAEIQKKTRFPVQTFLFVESRSKRISSTPTLHLLVQCLEQIKILSQMVVFHGDLPW